MSKVDILNQNQPDVNRAICKVLGFTVSEDGKEFVFPKDLDGLFSDKSRLPNAILAINMGVDKLRWSDNCSDPLYKDDSIKNQTIASAVGFIKREDGKWIYPASHSDFGDVEDKPLNFMQLIKDVTDERFHLVAINHSAIDSCNSWDDGASSPADLEGGE